MSKRISGLVVLAALALALTFTLSAVAEDKAKTADTKATLGQPVDSKMADTKAAGAKTADAKTMSAESGKATYLIVSPHTKAECLAALDALAAKGEATLSQYDFGCMSGDHTCYLKTQATSEQEALAQVPESLRTKAKAIKLTKFTVEQVKALHTETKTH